MAESKNTSAEPRQLGLPIRLSDAATLANFCCVPDSQHKQILAAIGQPANDQPSSENFIYLWGATGSGVSHLLQAACHEGQQQGLQVQYLPLDELLDFDPPLLLENMEQLDLVCLDHLQVISESSLWQQAVFDLYNRVRERGGRLLVGANSSPRELPLNLKDLQSRLGWGLVFQLPVLSDEDKVAVLQFRAARRGIEFAAEPARFLIRRSGRDMVELMEKLDALEQAAIDNHRTLTIPFLKETFGW